jgi:glycosyltransferase involved in cell wall biosynthesis
MRVLSVAFPQMPVGTPDGGGAEQILSIVEASLVERGHQSVVVACEGSRVAGDLIETPRLEGWPESHRKAIDHALAHYSIDLIHFHGLDFHEYLPACETPMLATLHLPISFYPQSIFNGHMPPGLTINCVSQNQVSFVPIQRSTPVIPNGIPTENYAPAKRENFLLWLGRICPEKGVHIALDIAHRLNTRLIIAGSVHSYAAHQKYFSRCINPKLDDKRVYVGPANPEKKRVLLGHAQCLLVPSLVAETSSLVSMEALSSGTPVIGFRTGALPEIIDDGETGFIVDSEKQMAEAIARVNQFSRPRCRSRAIKRFSAGRMVDRYLALYREMTTRNFGSSRAPQENL